MVELVIRSVGENDSVLIKNLKENVFEKGVETPFSANIAPVLVEVNIYLKEHNLTLQKLSIEYNEARQTARRIAISCAEGLLSVFPQLEVEYQEIPLSIVKH